MDNKKSGHLNYTNYLSYSKNCLMNQVGSHPWESRTTECHFWEVHASWMYTHTGTLTIKKWNRKNCCGLAQKWVIRASTSPYSSLVLFVGILVLMHGLPGSQPNLHQGQISNPGYRRVVARWIAWCSIFFQIRSTLGLPSNPDAWQGCEENCLLNSSRTFWIHSNAVRSHKQPFNVRILDE